MSVFPLARIDNQPVQPGFDPMTGQAEWGMRSMQDDPTSDSWGGQGVFDVYSKSQGTALDDSKYKDW